MTKQRLRNLVAVFAAMAAVWTLGSGAMAAAPGGQPNGSVKLTIIGWGPEFESLQNEDRQAMFKAAFPNVTLELMQVPTGQDYNSKIAAMAAAGVPPDVVWTDKSKLIGLATLGILEPLEPYIKASNIDMSLYAPANDGVFGGVLYSFPAVSYPYLHFYNRDLLGNYGVAEPRPTWDHAEYQQIAAKTTQGPLGKRTIWGTMSPGRRFQGFIASEAWPFKNGKLDQNAWYRLIDITQWASDFVYKYEYSPVVTKEGSLFEDGKMGMAHLGTWAFSTDAFRQWDFNWGVQVQPKGADGQFPIFITNGWAIVNNSPNKALAWEFIKWFTGKEHQLAMARNFQVPSYMPVVSQAFPGQSPEVVETIIRVFRLAEKAPVTQSKEEDLAMKEIDRAQNRSLRQGESASKALEAVRNRIETILAGQK